MRKEQSRPRWWQLYLLTLGTAGLLVLGAWAPMSERGQQVAAIGIVLLFGGLVEAWLRANRRTLGHIDGLILVEQPGPEVMRDAPGEEWQPLQGSWLLLAEDEAQFTAVLVSSEAGTKEPMTH
jgi:hypothetical protein